MTRGSLTANQKLQVTNAVLTRAVLMSRMGQSYGGKRDLYEALGYPRALSFEDFKARYIRQDIAKRIVDAFPDTCWAKAPEVVESDAKDTNFEKAWKALLKKIPIWSYLKRVDKVSGIGRYGVLFMGFDDNKPPDEPVTSATKLLYLRPFEEVQATIQEWERDPSNERYGLPKFYNLQIIQPPATGASSGDSKTIKVHYSRVIHIADGLTTDDVCGTPRLEPVYNRLQDIEMIAGGGAEMWWRGAFPGLVFKADEGSMFDTDPIKVTQMEDQIDEYVHGVKRYLKMQGVETKQLTPQMADATKPFDVEITLISICTGIPKRVLMGTERGELASSQDESAWDDRVDERRVNFCAPYLIRPFIDKLVELGILPKPKTDYDIKWTPIHIMNEKERATIAKDKTEALARYAGTPGTDVIVAPPIFLHDILGFSDEDVTKIEKANKIALAEEQKRMKEEAAIMAKYQKEQTAVKPAGGKSAAKA